MKINRPDIDDYKTSEGPLIRVDEYVKYVRDLETYCDELEQQLQKYEDAENKTEDSSYDYMSFGEMKMHSWNN